MREQKNLSGRFTFGGTSAGTSLIVNRMGYGAMQLAGQDGEKRVWGPPRDRDEAVRLGKEEEFDRKGWALVGDLNPLDVAGRATAYTPVPGGVGPLTIAMLMANTVRAARLRRGIL